MEGNATISADILARYAADATTGVSGVRGLVERHLPPQRGVRVAESDGRVTVEVHVEVEWGTSIPDVGRRIQQRVGETLARMADLRPAAVDVVVEEIGAPG